MGSITIRRTCDSPQHYTNFSHPTSTSITCEPGITSNSRIPALEGMPPVLCACSLAQLPVKPTITHLIPARACSFPRTNATPQTKHQLHVRISRQTVIDREYRHRKCLPQQIPDTDKPVMSRIAAFLTDVSGAVTRHTDGQLPLRS